MNYSISITSLFVTAFFQVFCKKRSIAFAKTYAWEKKKNIFGQIGNNWKIGIIPNDYKMITLYTERYTGYLCYGITQDSRFECVKCHTRISVCLQFTKYGLVFMRHVVTANKFGKGVFAESQCSRNAKISRIQKILIKVF